MTDRLQKFVAFFSLSLSHWFSSSLFDFIFILFYFFGVFFISFKFSLVGWFEFLRKGEKSRRRFPFLFGMIFVSSSSFSSFGFFFSISSSSSSYSFFPLCVRLEIDLVTFVPMSPGRL